MGAVGVDIEIRIVNTLMHSAGSVPWACELKAVGTLKGTFTQAAQRIKITGTSASFPLGITTFNGAGTKTPGAGVTWWADP